MAARPRASGRRPDARQKRQAKRAMGTTVRQGLRLLHMTSMLSSVIRLSSTLRGTTNPMRRCLSSSEPSWPSIVFHLLHVTMLHGRLRNSLFVPLTLAKSSLIPQIICDWKAPSCFEIGQSSQVLSMGTFGIKTSLIAVIDEAYCCSSTWSCIEFAVVVPCVYLL